MTKFTQEQVDELNSKIKTTEEALQNAPDTDDDFFVVPKVIED